MSDNDHNDPHYWKLGIFYFNPNDTRFIIPKRIPAFGLTVNFAHPLAVLLVFIFAAIILFASPH